MSNSISKNIRQCNTGVSLLDSVPMKVSNLQLSLCSTCETFMRKQFTIKIYQVRIITVFIQLPWVSWSVGMMLLVF